MPTTNILTRPQIIKLVLALVLLALVFVAYTSRSVTYPVTDSGVVHFTNAGLLRDRASRATNKTIVDHLKYYLATQNVAGKSLTMTDTPHYDYGGSLVFSFVTDSDTTPREVRVDTASFGPSVTSTTISIDGQQATYAPATSLYDAKFTSFDVLTRTGLSSVQAYEIQTLLLDHLPAQGYVLDTNSATTNNIRGLTYTDFSFASKGKLYKAQNISAGITDVLLTVKDSSGVTVFRASQNLSN